MSDQLFHFAVSDWSLDHTHCQSFHPSSSRMDLMKLCQDPCATCRRYRNSGSPNYTVSLHRQFVTPYLVWSYIFCCLLWPAFSDHVCTCDSTGSMVVPRSSVCSCNKVSPTVSKREALLPADVVDALGALGLVSQHCSASSCFVAKGILISRQ